MSERSKEVENLIELSKQAYKRKKDAADLQKANKEVQAEAQQKITERMARELIDEPLRQYARFERTDTQALLWIEVPGLAPISRRLSIAQGFDDVGFLHPLEVGWLINDRTGNFFEFIIHNYFASEGKVLMDDYAGSEDLAYALAIADELGDTKPEAEMEAKKQLEEAAVSAKKVPFVPDYGACPFFRMSCLGPKCALFDTGNSMCVFHTINMALLDIANK